MDFHGLPMNVCSLLLQSKAAEYEVLRTVLRTFGEIEGYSEGFLALLELSMKEAFVNAVSHGNKSREELFVEFAMRADFSGEQLILEAEISDSGSGFSPEQLPNPTLECFLLRTSGRGLYIIRSIAEIVGVEVSDGRSTLKLRYFPY
ncbi:MAG: ATP-binding protein [Chlorobiaceae bacterium]|nr:ATP-binding protein [Chlorobiaceae bacterium]